MNGIKGYISIREASYRWGVSERRVNQYCAEGRIPGASRFGRSWAIPENAEKPSDPRFQVSSIPMLVVFKDGKAVAKSVGYRPKAEITAMVESAK